MNRTIALIVGVGVILIMSWIIVAKTSDQMVSSSAIVIKQADYVNDAGMVTVYWETDQISHARLIFKPGIEDILLKTHKFSTTHSVTIDPADYGLPPYTVEIEACSVDNTCTTATLDIT